jgi:hypothetical protein
MQRINRGVMYCWASAPADAVIFIVGRAVDSVNIMVSLRGSLAVYLASREFCV